jgi:AcrR family transcriptional regulator
VVQDERSGERGSTRQQLIESAEVLFATRGIDAPSLAELTKAAGLANTGAVHYYFGGREELLAAIVEEHRSALDERREQLLDELEAAGDVTPAGLVRCLISPMIELLDTPRGRAYLSIAAQRAQRPKQGPPTPRPVVLRLLRLEGRPSGRAPVAAFLVDLGFLTATSALAQRVRLEEVDGRDAGLGRDEFARQLLDAVVRIVAVHTEEDPP